MNSLLVRALFGSRSTFLGNVARQTFTNVNWYQVAGGAIAGQLAQPLIKPMTKAAMSPALFVQEAWEEEKADRARTESARLLPAGQDSSVAIHALLTDMAKQLTALQNDVAELQKKSSKAT